MTCHIEIGTFKPITTAHSLEWSSSVDNFSDTATIKFPAITTLKRDGDTYERLQTGLQFKEGMSVGIYAGYDGKNDLRFTGFIRRINFTIPVEIECEGYSYQLRKKLDFTKSYTNSTVKKILSDLIEGTDITLSNAIPDIPIPKVTFKNVSGTQVLDWFKDKCLLTVYFNRNELYVGALQLEAKGTKKFRLGWNVIKDNELKFNDQKEFADVRIEVGGRDKKGKHKREGSGTMNSQVKRMRSAITDPATLKKIADQKRSELVNRGYEGSITAFLIPSVEPGMAAHIDDTKYQERQGLYFITGVSGSFSTSGGRQKIKIGNSLGNG